MGPIARVVETHSSVRLCEPVKQTLTITVLDQFQIQICRDHGGKPAVITVVEDLGKALCA